MDSPRLNTPTDPNSSLTTPTLDLTIDQERVPLTTLSLSQTKTNITHTIFPLKTSFSTPPLNLTPDEKRALFFNIDSSFELPAEQFDNDWWPVVSNIWTQFSSCKLLNGNTWKVFICHFNKHRASSERKKEEILNNKRRKTMI